MVLPIRKRRSPRRAVSAAASSLRGVLARLWRARGGATAVEMAFLLPVFMLFLLGICEFGRALWTQTALQFAVEAAARCAAVSPSLCTAAGGTTMDVAGLRRQPGIRHDDPVQRIHLYAERDLRRRFATERRVAGHRQLLFDAVVPALVPVNITLSAKSCHP